MAAAGGSLLLTRSRNGLTKKKKEKEVTDRELWVGCCIKWLLRTEQYE